MKRPLYILCILIPTAIFTTGFDWGFGNDSPCRKAQSVLKKFPTARVETPVNKEEDTILSLCPDGPPGLFVKALRLEREGRQDEAAEQYRELLKMEPDFPLASGNLGLLYLKKGLLDEAVVELTKAAGGTDDPAFHKGLGEIFNQREIYSLAEYHYKEATKGLPADALVRAGLGEALVNLGKTARAEEEYRRAIALDSGLESARVGLGLLYFNKNDYDRAIDEFKKALNSNPGNTEIRTLLAESYDKKGDKTAADKEYALLGINRNPAPPAVAQEVELEKKGDDLLAAKEYEKAYAAYVAALKAKPDNAEMWKKAAQAAVGAGKDDDAIAALREVIRFKGESNGVHHQLGVLYEKKGLLDEAVVEYKQSLRLAENADARRRLADIYTQRGSFAQAVEQYKELLKTQKDDPSIHFKLGRVYGNAKNVKDAVTSYEQVVALDPANVEAHRELANIYKKKSQTEDAEKHFREVLKLKKDDADARTALLGIYVEKKQYDDVLALLKENVDLNPTDPNAHYKLGLIYEFNKDYDSAIENYKKTSGLNSEHAKALNALGRVYMKTGRIAEAKEALEAARTADPDLEEPRVLLENIRDELSPQPKKYTKKSKKGKTSKKATKKSKKTTKSKKPAKKGAAEKKKKKKNA